MDKFQVNKWVNGKLSSVATLESKEELDKLLFTHIWNAFERIEIIDLIKSKKYYKKGLN